MLRKKITKKIEEKNSKCIVSDAVGVIIIPSRSCSPIIPKDTQSLPTKKES
jgi:hypothetical protein